MATSVRHHRVFRHLVEQRVDRVAALRVSPVIWPVDGRHAQTVHHDDPMRQAVEQPGAVVHVRARLAEEQPLREVAAGQFDLAFLRLIGIAGQRVEAFPVLGRPQQRGCGLNQRSSQSWMSAAVRRRV